MIGHFPLVMMADTSEAGTWQEFFYNSQLNNTAPCTGLSGGFEIITAMSLYHYVLELSLARKNFLKHFSTVFVLHD